MPLPLRTLLFALGLVAFAGCASQQPIAPELAHRLDDHLDQPCQEFFLTQWGRPCTTRQADDGLVITWDRRDGSGRALWRLVFDRDGILRSYRASRFAGCVTYGQVAW